MALVVGDLEKGTIPVVGGLAGYEVALKTITFDNNYPTGGEPLTAADLGLGTVIFCDVEPVPGSATTAYVTEYDYANSKVKVFTSNGAAPAALLELGAASAALDTQIARVFAIGTPA